MIKSLQNKNVQSHKDILLEFHPRVNVLVGSSDSGKTVAMRAIEWIRTNRPLGDDLRSHWGGETVASLRLEDALVIRQKGKVNKYMVDDEDFKAMGADVPEQIRKLLNLSDINIQHQFDPPFLLSYSPGEVAQTLNKLVNIEEIDKALANVAKKLKQAERDLKYETENEVVLTEKIKQFEYLDKAEVELNILAELEKEASMDRAYASRLKELIQIISLISVNISQLQPLLQADKDLNKLINLHNDWTTHIKESAELMRVLGLILWTTSSIKEIKLVTSAETDLEGLEMLNVMRFKAFDAATLVSNAVRAVNVTMGAINTTSGDLKVLEEAFNALMPNVCPLCGQKVSKGKPPITPPASNGITAKEMLIGIRRGRE